MILMVKVKKNLKIKILSLTSNLLLFITIFLLGGHTFLMLSREHFVNISSILYGDDNLLMNSRFLDFTLHKHLALIPLLLLAILIFFNKKQENLAKKIYLNLTSAFLCTLSIYLILHQLYLH